MNAAITQVSEYAFLAQAVYADFMGGIHNAFMYSDEQISKAPQEEERCEFSLRQAKAFLDKYKLADYLPNTASGFSESIFQSKETGEYIFSIRGTEVNSENFEAVFNSVDDILGADIGNVGFNGIAIEQAIDVFNDFQRVTAVKGRVFLQIAYNGDSPFFWDCSAQVEASNHCEVFLEKTLDAIQKIFMGDNFIETPTGSREVLRYAQEGVYDSDPLRIVLDGEADRWLSASNYLSNNYYRIEGFQFLPEGEDGGMVSLTGAELLDHYALLG
ncbi:MAG: hypothetical protein LBG69_05195 [Zoogloeaceae bacterium]|jgi:hypothetical protein|nr:hypothetical protein [Zoogloeaceae bacterium]